MCKECERNSVGGLCNASLGTLRAPKNASFLKCAAGHRTPTKSVEVACILYYYECVYPGMVQHLNRPTPTYDRHACFTPRNALKSTGNCVPLHICERHALRIHRNVPPMEYSASLRIPRYVCTRLALAINHHDCGGPFN